MSEMNKMRARLSGDPRVKNSFAYALWMWLRNPRYAARRRAEKGFYRGLLGNRDGKLIFDIGACAGSKTELFQAYGQVICIEPTAGSVLNLKRRFAKYRNVTIVQAAVADTPGFGTLLEFGTGSAYNTLDRNRALTFAAETQTQHGIPLPTPTETQVRLITIDQLVREYGNPDYIKMDIEGYEARAVRGMSEPHRLLSAEFNLPQFRSELEQVVETLERLDTSVRFNAAVEEPPRTLEFADWVTGEALLARVEARSWGYLELFCRSAGR